MKSPAFNWFLRLWAVAIIAHIAGNPPGWRDAALAHPLGVVTLGLGAVAIAVLARPNRVLGLSLAALTVASVVLEAPVVGNHWVVAGLVSVLMLVALLRPDPWAVFAPGARGILISFYAFAAFAKLNRGFFDPEVSCGVTYANQLLASFRLPEVPVGDWRAVSVAALTAMVELSIPILLLNRRTRYHGVLLGSVFHLFISFDLDQHFYDFSAVLVALFSLFLADDVLTIFGSPLRVRRPTAVALGGLLGLIVVASVTVPRRISFSLLDSWVFLLWIPWALFLIGRIWQLRRSRPNAAESWGRLGAVGAVLVALTVFNGLTPYLELKTGYGFNMYANLVTADGRSNHYLIPRTIPLTDVQRDPLIVLESSDPGLSRYVDSGWAIPRIQLLDYLVDHRSSSVTVTGVVSGGEVTLTGTDGVALPWWRDRFQLFRAIDLNDPPRCQLVWLPAR